MEKLRNWKNHLLTKIDSILNLSRLYYKKLPAEAVIRSRFVIFLNIEHTLPYLYFKFVSKVFNCNFAVFGVTTILRFGAPVYVLQCSIKKVSESMRTKYFFFKTLCWNGTMSFCANDHLGLQKRRIKKLWGLLEEKFFFEKIFYLVHTVHLVNSVNSFSSFI